MNNNLITLENKHFILTISPDCIGTSLVCKKTGEECIKKGEEMPLFSVTEERPYNNEVKLAHPNKRTTFMANRVRQEGDNLIVGFEIIDFEAVIKVNVKDDYMSFRLEEFIYDENSVVVELSMDWPPVLSLRLLQLSLSARERFGEWLNVLWDDKAAINVLSTSPYEMVDSERRNGYRVLYADAHRDIKLEGAEAALICTTSDSLLDCIEQIEEDFDLPRGVQSRRDPKTKGSIYRAGRVSPANIDAHIYYAKKGGFTKVLIGDEAFHESHDYTGCNGFVYTEHYNSLEDIKTILDRFRAEGMIPGYHILQTHIGVETKYVTPVADYRLNLTKHFTLSKPLGENDTELYVAQNPRGAVMHPDCRVLMFEGELIYYDGYTTEPPYRFTGLKRGHFKTNIIPHKAGTIGGILDLSEFLANSVYIDQDTDLQDEVAEKLGAVYDQGMEFIYFDGSEGVDAPYEFHVANAQYRVYKVLKNKPIYCEGAAKSHFSWHMLSGGNAFDVFETDVFKDAIVKYPLEEASRMANDFTQVDFGWWQYCEDSRPDVFEFGLAKAVSCDCPVTIFGHQYDRFNAHPRTDDIFEVLRRWEDAKMRGWFTPEDKAMLKQPDKEHILLIDENGDYELCEYSQIKKAFGGTKDATVFVFTRKGKTYVVLWHNKGSAKVSLPIEADKLTYETALGGDTIPIEADGNNSILPIEKRWYLSTDLSVDAIVDAFENAKLI